MRNVTYFPPYSQEENIVTNAVLLLFSHVNRLAPNLLQGILNNLTDEELQLGPIFSNQVKGTKSVIDAVISQTPFEIHIETKLGDA